jgi:hypothetical protein
MMFLSGDTVESRSIMKMAGGVSAARNINPPHIDA